MTSPSAGWAQGAVGPAGIPNPPDIDMLDDNDVQIDSGYSSFSVPDVSIGGAAGLSHVTRNDPSAGSGSIGATADDRYRFSGFYPDLPITSSFVGGIMNPNLVMVPTGSTFSFQGVSERFAGTIESGNTGASLSGDGGSLTNNGDNTWTYLDKNGINYLIDTGYLLPNSDVLRPVTKVTYPDGSTLKIHFKSSGGVYRIQGVEKSNGFFLKFFYAANGEATSANYRAWSQYNRIVAGNKAYEYCDLTADSCTFALSWPQSQAYFSNNDTRFSVVDSQSRETRFTLNPWFEVIAVKPATSDVDTITFEMCSRHYPGNCAAMNNSGGAYTPQITFLTYPGMVFAATQNGVRTTYGYQAAAGGHVNVLNSGNPYRGATEVLSLYDQYNYPDTGSLQRVTVPRLMAYYSGNAQNRLLRTIRPGSTHEEYVFDARRNLKLRSLYPIDGDTTPPLVTVIDYEPGCANILTCNKPRFVTDPKGNRTDYTYSAVHGGLVAVTGPAVNVATPTGTQSVRPQTRYEYVQRTAWLKNAAGTYTASAPIWVPAKESFCRASAATGNPAGPCATAGDEVATVYEYGPNGGPSNLLVRGIAVTADGQTLRTCYGYDRFGSKISETAPRAGLAQCP